MAPMRLASLPAWLATLLLIVALACGDDDGGDTDAGDDGGMSADAGGGDDDGGDDGGDADGGPVPLCGGLAGLQCEDGEYCNWPDDSCGVADSAGVCEPRPGPDDCEPDGDKVCACNGASYVNACAAAVAGADVSATGSCGRVAP